MKKLILLSLCLLYMQAGEQVVCRDRNYDKFFKESLRWNIKWEVNFYEGGDDSSDAIGVEIQTPYLVDEIISKNIGGILDEAINSTREMLIAGGHCKKVVFE